MEMGDFFRTRPIWRCLVNWAPDLQLVCAEITFSMQISAAYHRHVFFKSIYPGDQFPIKCTISSQRMIDIYVVYAHLYIYARSLAFTILANSCRQTCSM